MMQQQRAIREDEDASHLRSLDIASGGSQGVAVAFGDRTSSDQSAGPSGDTVSPSWSGLGSVVHFLIRDLRLMG